MSKISRGWKVSIIIFLVLVADQTLKFWVKTHMTLHDDFQICSWFHISFTENNGMAFGIELFDKIFLTSFRIIASGVLIWYLCKICTKSTIRFGYCVCISLITAGAMGNILDCLFYGIIFNDSTGQVASLFPTGGGYGSFFYGKVVDMLYFPLIDTWWPDWVPFVGGDHLVFFRPVFNLADSAITVGIIILLLFYRRDLSEVPITKGKETALDSTDK